MDGRGPKGASAADQGWRITSFAGTYVIQKDGTVDVQEQIDVDFGSLQKHGIFRDIPIKYRYDDSHSRLIDIAAVRVTQDDRPETTRTETSGENLRIQIGDATRIISGAHSYHIAYQMKGALNPFNDHDELYLNVTGNGWGVPIETATAHVDAPAIKDTTCFEGPLGSTRPCNVAARGTSIDFTATQILGSGSGLTIVTSLPKGTVSVAPPTLVEDKSQGEQVRDFLGLYPVQLAAAVFVAVLVVAGLMRLWWLKGRDLWSGDTQVLTGTTGETELPLFAQETVVPEYTPPEVGATKRRLRPAEVGVLMDERADTLDVSATIIDLAVRGYIRIEDLGATGLFGKGSKDYRFTKLKDADAELLGYEQKLLNALFDASHASIATVFAPVLAAVGVGERAPPASPGMASVKLSDLKNKFADDLRKVKSELYGAVTTDDGLFPGNPETVRLLYVIAGVVIAALGAGAIFALGAAVGAGIIGVPIVIGGLALAVMSQAMPRRTAQGRETLRRARGFREFMTTVTDEDKLKFEEEKGIFDRYLPYAIVFHCTAEWAKRFEGLAGEAVQPGGWYISPNPFLPLAFAAEVNSFSSHISSAIASTPGGSGISGFGGGGFAGGGVGGGGGGSW